MIQLLLDTGAHNDSTLASVAASEGHEASTLLAWDTTELSTGIAQETTPVSIIFIIIDNLLL